MRTLSVVCAGWRSQGRARGEGRVVGRRAAAVLAAFSMILATSCSLAGKPTATPAAVAPGISGNLVVFAASSLTETFNEVKAALQTRNPHLAIAINFAGTPALRIQLEQGARADLFASADQEQMELAVGSSVVQGSPVAFATNRLVVVAPAGGSKVQTLADLARPGVRLVLALKDVPVGAYSRQALAKMTASGEFGPDFSTRVLGNVASEEINVRQALSKVLLGEADASIVYRTDVAPDVSNKLRQVAIPDSFNVTAVYLIAEARGTGRPEAAQEFIAFLRSAEGRAILARHGFGEVQPQ